MTPVQTLVPAASGPASSTAHQPSINDYSILGALGSGGTSEVFLVRQHFGVNKGQLLALKAIPKRRLLDPHSRQNVVEEALIHQKVNHPFVIRLYAAFQDPAYCYLVMQYAGGRDMLSYLDAYGELSESEAILPLSQVVLAIQHLHDLGIVYRDLKPENLLLEVDGNILLGDFGLAKLLLHEGVPYAREAKGRRRMRCTRTVCGSEDYMAPEVVTGQEYSFSIDYWALGVLLFEFLTAKSPFGTIGAANSIFCVVNKTCALPSLPDTLSEMARDIVCGLLKLNPAERLGCDGDGEATLRAHPFFNQINWSDVMAKRVVSPLTRSKPHAASPITDTDRGELWLLDHFPLFTLDEPVRRSTLPDPASSRGSVPDRAPQDDFRGLSTDSYHRARQPER